MKKLVSSALVVFVVLAVCISCCEGTLTVTPTRTPTPTIIEGINSVDTVPTLMTYSTSALHSANPDGQYRTGDCGFDKALESFWNNKGKDPRLYPYPIVEDSACSAALTAVPVAQATFEAYTQPTLASHPAGTTGRCNDGAYTYAQHSQGACSWHKGLAEWWGG